MTLMDLCSLYNHHQSCHYVNSIWFAIVIAITPFFISLSECMNAIPISQILSSAFGKWPIDCYHQNKTFETPLHVDFVLLPLFMFTFLFPFLSCHCKEGYRYSLTSIRSILFKEKVKDLVTIKLMEHLCLVAANNVKLTILTGIHFILSFIVHDILLCNRSFCNSQHLLYYLSWR